MSRLVDQLIQIYRIVNFIKIAFSIFYHRAQRSSRSGEIAE